MNEPLPDQNEYPLRLLLLPGMDGTGQLFSGFVDSLPAWLGCQVVCYPSGAPLSFSELVPLVRGAMPAQEPFVILAESFSSPIGVSIAADPPANLRGLVICAGFIQPPLRRIPRLLSSALAPLLFLLPLPSFAIRGLLLGRSAPEGLVENVRTAIGPVSRKVLVRRLRAVLACNASMLAAKIAIPVLYLQASDDRLVDSSAFEAIRRAKPDAQVTAIAGPHLILQRRPQVSAEAILPFLEQMAHSQSKPGTIK